MKVTLLGHASILVEMQGVRCLMDPVFQDPFEEGAVMSCPRRAVHVEKLPPIDVLILSHSHLDHFDIPSLARIPRKCHVICPKDHAIVYVLTELGFSNIHDTAPMTHMVFPKYELMTTHSNVTNVVEFGMIFKDRTGTFWNQVDTVVAPQTIEVTRKTCPKIDLLFAMYASQNFGFFESKGAGFPFKMHEMNLNTVLSIKPRLAVPGSAGFRFCGPSEWCNAFLFPVSRERFLSDLARLDPELRTCIANPGDEFEIAGNSIRHRPAASKIVTMLEEDSWRLRYDPTASIPPLSDPNPDGYSAERLNQAMDECISGLFGFVHGAHRSGDPVVDEYRRCRASYALRIVLPAGDEHACRITFGEDEPRIEGGTAVGPADIVHHIAASALAAWVAREKSYFYFRAFSRKFTTLYSFGKSDGKLTIEPKELPDLLGHYLQKKARGADMALKQRLDLQLQPYLRRP